MERRIDCFSERDFIYWIGMKEEPIVIANKIIESDLFKRRWKTSQAYIESQLKKITPIKLDPTLYENISLKKVCFYVTHLSHNIIFQHPRIPYLKYETQQEFAREMYRGKISVYASILMYYLIKRLDLNIEISFIQGFYSFKLPPNPLQKEIIGAHAFLLINETIIDATLQQIGENYFLEDKEYIIIGDNLPDGIDMYGWKEDESTILEYAEEFAIYRDMSIDEWINTHEIAASKVLEHNLNEFELPFIEKKKLI